MSPEPGFQEFLNDVESDVRLLQLLDDAYPTASGWAEYGLPPEEGYDLVKLPSADALATFRTIRRLVCSVQDLRRALHGT